VLVFFVVDLHSRNYLQHLEDFRNVVNSTNEGVFLSKSVHAWRSSVMYSDLQDTDGKLHKGTDNWPNFNSFFKSQVH